MGDQLSSTDYGSRLPGGNAALAWLYDRLGEDWRAFRRSELNHVDFDALTKLTVLGFVVIRISADVSSEGYSKLRIVYEATGHCSIDRFLNQQVRLAFGDLPETATLKHVPVDQFHATLTGVGLAEREAVREWAEAVEAGDDRVLGDDEPGSDLRGAWGALALPIDEVIRYAIHGDCRLVSFDWVGECEHGANNASASRLFHGEVPKNLDLVDLVNRIDAAAGTGISRRSIAIEFKGGNVEKAESLLSAIRRYERKGRLTLPRGQ